MSFQNLTFFNKTLQNQIWGLRDLVTNLSIRNYELREEMKDVQILNRGSQAKMGCYKMLIEELQKERKNMKDTVQQKEERLRLLEYKTKTLKRANKQLVLQINVMADQQAVCQDCQTATDMLGKRSEARKIKNHAQWLEDKLGSLQQQYEKEKQQIPQLQEALRELAQTCESQRNVIIQLKGLLETAEKQAARQGRNYECWLPMESRMETGSR